MTSSRKRRRQDTWNHDDKRKRNRNWTHCDNVNDCIKTLAPMPSLSCELHVNRCLNFNKITRVKANADVIWHMLEAWFHCNYFKKSLTLSSQRQRFHTSRHCDDSDFCVKTGENTVKNTWKHCCKRNRTHGNRLNCRGCVLKRCLKFNENTVTFAFV